MVTPTQIYYLVKCTNPKCRETKVTAAKDWCKCNHCGKHIRIARTEKTELQIGGII